MPKSLQFPIAAKWQAARFRERGGMLFAVVANLLRDYDQVVHRAKLNLQNRDWIGLQRDDQELAMLHDRLDAGIAKLMRDEIVKEAFRHPRREAHRIARRER